MRWLKSFSAILQDSLKKDLWKCTKSSSDLVKYRFEGLRVFMCSTFIIYCTDNEENNTTNLITIFCMSFLFENTWTDFVLYYLLIVEFTNCGILENWHIFPDDNLGNIMSKTRLLGPKGKSSLLASYMTYKSWHLWLIYM